MTASGQKEPTGSLRVIIQRMIQTIRSYRLVKWVDKNIRIEDKAHPEVARRGHKHRLPSNNLVMPKYAELRHKSESEIGYLIEYCVSKHYLACEEDDGAQLYVDNDKGRDLIEGGWYGLVREIWKRDGSLLKLIGVIIITIIGTAFIQQFVIRVWWAVQSKTGI
jgi:hypothetical protein